MDSEEDSASDVRSLGAVAERAHAAALGRRPSEGGGASRHCQRWPRPRACRDLQELASEDPLDPGHMRRPSRGRKRRIDTDVTCCRTSMPWSSPRKVSAELQARQFGESSTRPRTVPRPRATPCRQTARPGKATRHPDRRESYPMERCPAAVRRQRVPSLASHSPVQPSYKMLAAASLLRPHSPGNSTLTSYGEPKSTMDIVDRKRRSEMMSAIKGRDTAPEIAVRRAAHRLGLRFRLHRKDLPGRPDLVFPRHRAVIFVHGCFWHRHLECQYAYTPKTRARFWTRKFSQNIARDRRNEEALHLLGWRVLVIWECQTHDPVHLEQCLLHYLPRGKPDPTRTPK